MTNKAGKIASITVDGVSIRGINANEPINCPVGIIALALIGDNSSIIDCVVTNSSNTKSEIISHSVGGICLSNNVFGNTIIQSCKVENCDFKYSTSNQSVSIAGICGSASNYSIIKSCILENVNISCENFSKASIFGISNTGVSCTSCTVKNTSIICETTANNSFIEIGGICGSINCGTIDGCSVANTTIKAVSTNNLRIGGICCNQIGSGNNLKNSKVENSVLTASGTQGNIGGIAGFGNEGTIDSCYISGTKVYGEDLNEDSNYFYVGGIIGDSEQNNKIESCFVTKSTSSSSIVQGTGKSINVGGIVGYAMGSDISKCCVKDDTTVSGNGNYSEIGGICGCFSSAFEEVVLSSCFVKDTSVSCTGNIAYFGGICGLTDSMAKLSACYFYEKDANHTITTSGTDYTFGYLVGYLGGKVYDSFTNKSTTNLVGNIDDNDESTSGDIINCYSGVGDKDTFSVKTWSDDKAYTAADSVWKDYDFSSFPPTLKP